MNKLIKCVHIKIKENFKVNGSFSSVFSIDMKKEDNENGRR